MYETTQAVSHILDVDQLLEKIMDLIFQSIEADRGCIMLRDGEPFFLDYQGGRKGALQYDIASLLYDAKADLPPELRRVGYVPDDAVPSQPTDVEDRAGSQSNARCDGCGVKVPVDTISA